MFPKRLKQLHISKKLTQQNTAHSPVITSKRYVKYEDRYIEPFFGILQKITVNFDVSTDELLGNTVITEQTKTVTVAGQEINPSIEELQIFEVFKNHSVLFHEDEEDTADYGDGFGELKD